MLIYATPRSSKTCVAGFFDDRLKVTIKAPPVDGAANEELMKFLQKKLGVSREDLELLQGHTGRRKAVLVRGKKHEEVRCFLVSG